MIGETAAGTLTSILRKKLEERSKRLRDAEASVDRALRARVKNDISYTCPSLSEGTEGRIIRAYIDRVEFAFTLESGAPKSYPISPLDLVILED